VRAYGWPGNVRELSNVLQRALLLADRGVIEPAHLGLAPLPSLPAPVAAADQRQRDGRPPDGFDFAADDCSLAAVERRLITAALNHTGGNISEVARLLRISRGALRHRMERLHIRLQTRLPE
jgi:DNA-binding NtrC family response regulator